MRKIYAIQFFEEVLVESEKGAYEEKLNAKPQKVQRTGMFLFDLNNTVRNRIGRVTRIERVRTHKLIFPFIQSLFVLLAPSALLFWSLYIFDLTTYTLFSVITAPAVVALAASVWAVWHVKGGFARVVGRRNGRVMESSSR